MTARSYHIVLYRSYVDALRESVKALLSIIEAETRRGTFPAPFAEIVRRGNGAVGVAESIAATYQPVRPRPTETHDWDYEPLRLVGQRFDLGPGERLAILLALAPEIDGRIARLFALLHDHAQKTRPSVALAVALAGTLGLDDVRTVLDLVHGHATRSGLLVIEGDGPLSGRSLRVHEDVMNRLVPCGRAGQFAPRFVGLECAFDDLVLDPNTRVVLRAWGERAPERPLVLGLPPDSGCTTIVAAAAALANLPVVRCVANDEQSLRAACRDAIWYDAALLCRLDAALDSHLVWSLLGNVRALAIVTTLEGVEQLAASAPRSPIVVKLDEPSPTLRVQLWRRLLPPGTISDEEIEVLAARFRFGPRRIAAAVKRADSSARTRAMSIGDLHAACRQAADSQLNALAQRLDRPFARRDLVVSERVNSELDLAIAWVRKQQLVLERWGLGRRIPVGRGLTALFSGTPGTGKTMAAQVLARELDQEVYRVDLSCIVSKWVGETEKQLARLFNEARLSDAILFFDEADAIFGKRSEVKQAHDRYANIEIGYLLQRMEDHEGVIILATNRMRDLDEAFVRRFHLIVDFPAPTPSERLRIWQSMLESLPCAADAEVQGLARELPLTGGEIKNVVLAAAFLAASEDSTLRFEHLERAVRREFAKNSRVLDERLLRASRLHMNGRAIAQQHGG